MCAQEPSPQLTFHFAGFSTAIPFPLSPSPLPPPPSLVATRGSGGGGTFCFSNSKKSDSLVVRRRPHRRQLFFLLLTVLFLPPLHSGADISREEGGRTCLTVQSTVVLSQKIVRCTGPLARLSPTVRTKPLPAGRQSVCQVRSVRRSCSRCRRCPRSPFVALHGPPQSLFSDMRRGERKLGGDQKKKKRDPLPRRKASHGVEGAGEGRKADASSPTLLFTSRVLSCFLLSRPFSLSSAQVFEEDVGSPWCVRGGRLFQLLLAKTIRSYHGSFLVSFSASPLRPRGLLPLLRWGRRKRRRWERREMGSLAQQTDRPIPDDSSLLPQR